MGRNTDSFWSVIPMVYGQLHLQSACKTRENYHARGGCPVCLFVCLINTVYVVNREDEEKEWTRSSGTLRQSLLSSWRSFPLKQIWKYRRCSRCAGQIRPTESPSA